MQGTRVSGVTRVPGNSVVFREHRVTGVPDTTTTPRATSEPTASTARRTNTHDTCAMMRLAVCERLVLRRSDPFTTWRIAIGVSFPAPPGGSRRDSRHGRPLLNQRHTGDDSVFRFAPYPNTEPKQSRRGRPQSSARRSPGRSPGTTDFASRPGFPPPTGWGLLGIGPDRESSRRPRDVRYRPTRFRRVVFRIRRPATHVGALPLANATPRPSSPSPPQCVRGADRAARHHHTAVGRAVRGPQRPRPRDRHAALGTADGTAPSAAPGRSDARGEPAPATRARALAAVVDPRSLVDPASSHMLVSKIKPCMSKYKQLYGETANGSLNQLSFI